MATFPGHSPRSRLDSASAFLGKTRMTKKRLPSVKVEPDKDFGSCATVAKKDAQKDKFLPACAQPSSTDFVVRNDASFKSLDSKAVGGKTAASSARVKLSAFDCFHEVLNECTYGKTFSVADAALILRRLTPEIVKAVVPLIAGQKRGVSHKTTNEQSSKDSQDACDFEYNPDMGMDLVVDERKDELDTMDLEVTRINIEQKDNKLREDMSGFGTLPKRPDAAKPTRYLSPGSNSCSPISAAVQALISFSGPDKSEASDQLADAVPMATPSCGTQAKVSQVGAPRQLQSPLNSVHVPMSGHAARRAFVAKAAFVPIPEETKSSPEEARSTQRVEKNAKMKPSHFPVSLYGTGKEAVSVSTCTDESLLGLLKTYKSERDEVLFESRSSRKRFTYDGASTSGDLQRPIASIIALDSFSPGSPALPSPSIGLAHSPTSAPAVVDSESVLSGEANEINLTNPLPAEHVSSQDGPVEFAGTQSHESEFIIADNIPSVAVAEDPSLDSEYEGSESLVTSTEGVCGGGGYVLADESLANINLILSTAYNTGMADVSYGFPSPFHSHLPASPMMYSQSSDGRLAASEQAAGVQSFLLGKESSMAQTSIVVSSSLAQQPQSSAMESVLSMQNMRVGHLAGNGMYSLVPNSVHDSHGMTEGVRVTSEHREDDEIVPSRDASLVGIPPVAVSLPEMPTRLPRANLSLRPILPKPASESKSAMPVQFLSGSDVVSAIPSQLSSQLKIDIGGVRGGVDAVNVSPSQMFPKVVSGGGYLSIAIPTCPQPHPRFSSPSNLLVSQEMNMDSNIWFAAVPGTSAESPFLKHVLASGLQAESSSVAVETKPSVSSPPKAGNRRRKENPQAPSRNLEVASALLSMGEDKKDVLKGDEFISGLVKDEHRSNYIGEHEAGSFDRCSPGTVLVEDVEIDPVKSRIGTDCYECGRCKRVFTSLVWLARHVKRVCPDRSQRKWKCDTCDKAFRHAFGLQQHLLTHTGQRPYKCDQCSKAFYSANDLRRHSRTHSGERPYKCLDCDKTFATTISLKTHSFIHSGERPHRCPHCTKTFATSSKLSRHVITHADKRPYACDRCAKTFNRSGDLRRHYTSLHNEQHQLLDCGQCNKLFATESVLQNHRLSHNRSRPTATGAKSPVSDMDAVQPGEIMMN